MPRAYALTTVTPPPAEPLTTAEAKAHLRLGIADDDTLVASYVKSAREWFESAGNRACVTQVLEMRLDQFPGQYPYGFPGQYDFVPHRTSLTWLDRYGIFLARAPLVSVAFIKYVDINGVEQTLDPTLYQVDPYSEPGRVSPVYGQTWPVARAQMNAVTIRYTAGYGATEAFVPESIRQLIRLLVSHQYENREPIVIGTIANELPHAIAARFQQTRVLMAA